MEIVAAMNPENEEEWNKKYPKPRINLIYRMIRSTCIGMLNVFFRDIDLVGLENIPATGPVILVGNHKNQFVDAVMVISTVFRPVSFLVAEKSMHRRVIGDVAKSLSAIPVIRPQDRAKIGLGKITSYDALRCIINGNSDCKFLTEFKKGELLFLSRVKGVAPLQIQEILSNDSVVVSHPTKPEDEADGTGGQPAHLLIPTEGVSYKIIPKIDQKELFSKVHDALCAGGCIGIFPEGGSSDRTDLLPLKVGVAIMALGAIARGAPVKIIPFGINYNQGHRWRSRVLVDIGKPLTVSSAILERYNMGAAKEAQTELLHQIEGALRAVTFNAPDEKTLNILRTMRRMYQGPIKLPPKDFMELNRRFAQAFGRFRDEESFLDIVGRVFDYTEEIKRLRLYDRHVGRLPPLGSFFTACKTLVVLIVEVILVIILLTISIPGYILYLPLLLRIRFVVNQEVKKALAGSSVKVKGNDVAASQKMIGALIWVPVTLIFWTALSVILTVTLWPTMVNPYPVDTPLNWLFANAIWIIPLATFLLIPPIGYFNVLLVSFAYQRFYWFPYYYLIITSGCSRNSAGARLRLRRKEIALRIQEYYDRVISPTFPEWAEHVIISRQTLENTRRKSDYTRSVKIAEEIDQIQKATDGENPDDPAPTPATRKTIAALKISMQKIGENAEKRNNPV